MPIKFDAVEPNNTTPFAKKDIQKPAVESSGKVHRDMMELDHPEGSVFIRHHETRVRQILDALTGATVDELKTMISLVKMYIAGLITSYDTDGTKIYNTAGTNGLWVKETGDVWFTNTIYVPIVKAPTTSTWELQDHAGVAGLTMADGGGLTAPVSLAAATMTGTTLSAIGAGGLEFKDDGAVSSAKVFDGGHFGFTNVRPLTDADQTFYDNDGTTVGFIIKKDGAGVRIPKKITADTADSLVIEDHDAVAGLTMAHGGALTANVSLAAATMTGTTISAIGAGGLTIKDDGNNTAIFVEDGGQVGIANATPACALDVTGKGYFSLGREVSTGGTQIGWDTAWKTQDYVFDLLSPFVPNTGDCIIVSGDFADATNRIPHSLKRTSASVIIIYNFINNTRGTITCNDGNSGNILYSMSISL